MDESNLKKNIYFVHEFTCPNGIMPMGYSKETFSSVMTNILQNESNSKIYVNSNHEPYTFSEEFPLLEDYLIERNKHFKIITTANLPSVDDIKNNQNDDLFVIMFESNNRETLFDYYGKNIRSIESLISKKLLRYFKKCKNFKMVFIDPREGSYEHCYELINNINSFLDKNNIFEKNKVIISTNNDRITNLPNQNNIKLFNRIKLYNNNYCLFMAGRFISEIEYSGGVISENGYDYSLQDNISFEPRPKYFLMYNRNTSRMHRPWFVNLLYENNLLNKGIYSLIKNDEYDEFISKTNTYDSLGLNESDMSRLQNNTKNFYPSFIEEQDGEIVSWYHNFLSRKDEYEKTYFTIVSETNAESQYCFITEKTVKPIMNLHPFFILGNPGTLDQLKRAGFKTFDLWWNESYDSEIDFKKRCSMLVSEINKICNKSHNEMVTLLSEMEDILIYNKKHLQRLNRYKQFEKDFINVLTEEII